MIAAALAAFITVFFAEMGDKTQLVTLSMACRYPPLQVLGGAMVALAAVLGIAVTVGGLLSSALPHTTIAIVSGVLFVAIGIYSYLKKEKEAGCSNSRTGFIQTMIMVFIAEMGDKTQLAALFITASLGYPLAVFAGSMLAMLLNHLLAIYLGSRFLARLNPQYLKIGTAALFIIIGVIIIFTEVRTLV